MTMRIEPRRAPTHATIRRLYFGFLPARSRSEIIRKVSSAHVTPDHRASLQRVVGIAGREAVGFYRCTDELDQLTAEF